MKSQIKVDLSYLANSYFYNYKPSPRVLCQHRVLRNGAVIDNAIQEIISDNSYFKKISEDPPLKREV